MCRTVLSFVLLFGVVAAQAAAGGRAQGPWLRWTFDEPGDAALFLDASGRGRVGRPSGSVRREEGGPSGRALTGFESESAFVLSQPPNTPKPGAFPREWTFQCFFRDPMPLPDRPAVLARAAATEEGIVPWQLWIERSGKVHFGTQGKGTAFSTAPKEPFPWKRGVWYHAVVTAEPTTKKGDKEWGRRFRIWIAPADAPLGAPCMDFEHRTPSRPAESAALQVGGGAAGVGDGAPPAGALGKGALLDEVSLWPRILSEEELAEAHAAFLGAAGGGAAAAGAASPDALAKALALRWVFAEAGKTPVTKDASGNGRDGASHGRVRGGVPGRRGGKAFDGFGSPESFVEGRVPAGAFRGDWTLALWMKNPRLSSKQACVLAGGKPTEKEGNIPWQIWLDAKGTPHAAEQDATGHRFAAEGRPRRWEPNKWHFVAITHRSGKDAFGLRRDYFKVWIVPEGGKPGEPLLEAELGRRDQMAESDALRLGAAPVPKGKRVEIAPGGHFGGQLAEAAFYVGRAFSADDLAAVMTAR